MYCHSQQPIDPNKPARGIKLGIMLAVVAWGVAVVLALWARS